MQDPSIIVDFFSSTFAKDLRIDMLNYESVASLLPHASLLISSKFDSHTVCGLNSVYNMLRGFSQQIIQLKNMPVGRGVDLAREERIKKCDNCIEAFHAVKKSKGYMKALQTRS